MKSEYAKPALLLGSLGVLVIVGIVGCALAEVVVPLGFILMGVGLGGFALTIVSMIVVATVSEHRRAAVAKRPYISSRGGRGKVVACRVDPDSDEHEQGYVITVSVGENSPKLDFKCKKRHYIGDTVEFSGNAALPETLSLKPQYYDD